MPLPRPWRCSAWWFIFVSLIAACSGRAPIPPEPPVEVRRGDEAFRYRDYEVAINAYHAHAELIEKDEYTARVLYKTALAQCQLGRYSDALVTLDDLRRRYPDGRWVQVEALRGDAYRSVGERVAAIVAWDRGWELGSNNDRSKLRVRVATVARGLTNLELAKARRMVQSRDVENLLNEQLAKRDSQRLTEPMPDFEGAAAEEHVARGGHEIEPAAHGKAAGAKETAQAEVEARADADGRQARSATASTAKTKAAQRPAVEAAPPEVQDEGLGAPAAAQPVPVAVPAPAAPAPEHAVARGAAKVAVLLPLSGEDASVGERSLRAVQLAFSDAGRQLVVEDTNSSPAGASRAFDRLVQDPNVLVVIGPVTDSSAAPVAAGAARAQLPVLLLSHSANLDRDYVLQAGITQSHLMGELLDYAMARAHLRRFGVLYPDNADGNEFFATFRAQVERRGGTIIGTDGYAPDAKSLTAGLVHRWHDENNLQALVVPDSATAAAKVAKFLQKEMPDIALLGVSSWETLADPDLALSGVLFATGFYSESPQPSTRDFVGRFQKAYGSVPEAIEAQAYDAALLAKHALEAGADSRASVWRELQDAGAIEGATGALMVTATGVQRNTFLLQVSKGKLREIGAPVDEEQTKDAAAN